MENNNEANKGYQNLNIFRRLLNMIFGSNDSVVAPNELNQPQETRSPLTTQGDSGQEGDMSSSDSENQNAVPPQGFFTPNEALKRNLPVVIISNNQKPSNTENKNKLK